MNNKFKKVFVSLVASAMCVTGSIGAMSAYAGCSTTNVALKKTSFSNDWSVIWTFECNDTYTGSMTVGFDTWALDEDYVTLFGTGIGNHYAGVKNSVDDIEYTNTASAGSSTGKADVEHYGSPVKYYAFWY